MYGVKLRIVPKRVTWDEKDREVGIYANMGLHTRAIARLTHLSEGQVNYRLTRGNFVGARRLYREGESAEFKLAAKTIWGEADHQVLKHVKSLLVQSRKQDHRKLAVAA